MSEMKNLYKIPVTITTFDPSLKKMITLNYDIEAGLAKGQNLGVLIASAQSQAEKKFYKKYPAHKIDKINIDIEKKEFICKVKVKTKNGKPRMRTLPFTKELKERKITALGKDRLERRYIEVVYKGRKVLIILLKGERATFNFKWNRLIVTYHQNKMLQYVKILTEDIDGNSVLTKWDLNSFTTKHPRPYVEYLWTGGDFSNSLPLDEYKSCIRIAKIKFKKYLKSIGEVKKDG